MAREDPRLDEIDEAPESANGEALDASIRHQVFIERLKGGEVRTVDTFVQERLLPRLLDRIRARAARIAEKGFDTGPATTKRLADLEAAIRDSLSASEKQLLEGLGESLVELSKAEARMALASFERSLPAPLIREGVIEFTKPSARLLREAVYRRPFQGRTLRDWTSGFSAGVRQHAMTEIRTGLVLGDSIDTIARNVRLRTGEFTRTQAETLVRTSVNHVTTAARDALYSENEDLIEGVRIVATLDVTSRRRTCPICGGLDGQVFPVGKGPRPPFHPNCRCTTAPQLKSLRQLGVTKNDVDLNPSQRRSVDGNVPATTTYEDTLRRARPEYQAEVLGKRGADLFRSGRLRLDEFVDRNYRPLTVAELEKLAARHDS